MAAFVLIILFIQNELSFDKHNEHVNDVYRIGLDARVADQEIKTISSPAIMATQFLDEFPEIERATRVDAFSSEQLITVDDEPYYEANYFMADSSIFDIFTMPFMMGDPATALNRPNTMVISETVARKYFGDADPMGRTVQYDNRVDYEITGVMKDVPLTSHFRPEVITSFLTSNRANDPVWLNNSFITYVKLRPGSDPAALSAKFPDFVRAYVGPQIEQFMGQSYDEGLAAGLKYGWYLEGLGDIYLESDSQDQIGPTGDIRYLYILGAIGLFVLIIACINFMNLATARATGRAREVGIRKTLGSERGQLVRQFLGESITTAAISMAIAFGIVLLILPAFSIMAGAPLSIAPWLYGTVVIIALMTGVLAGLYPAFVLSGFQPATVLKGAFSASKSGTKLRSALVVFQFSISVILLIGTTVVYKQLAFIQDQDLGFDKDHTLVVPIETDNGLQTFDTFRDQLLAYSGVVNAASAGMVPGPDHIHNNTGFRGEGMREEDFFIAALGEVSNDYVETLGLRLIAGRDFDANFPSDTSGFVINEAAAAQMGFNPEDVIGKSLARLGGNADGSDRMMTVLGVVENANFQSLHTAVLPMVMGHWNTNQRYAPIRIRPENVEATLAFIEQAWTAWEPGYPFRHFFVDSDYQQFYEQEQRLGSLYTSFTILAILIACLGLFGLASFITTQRTKEIGVRKVMGASVPGIVVLLSKEFTYLVLIACLIGFPVAWYAMDIWLQEFAYATSMGWIVFAASGIAALSIAWLTVSYQSIRTATANPVESLRYE